jgi:L-histidine Nalpha-methyltransferase
MDVTIPQLDLTVHFAAGEEVRTEVSTKFREGSLVAELTAAGLVQQRFFTDEAGDFGLSLSVPAPLGT